MALFETVHTCCGHNENVHVSFCMELELIFRELRPFKLSHFCTVGYGICVIKMCMWVLDGAKINFDRIMSF